MDSLFSLPGRAYDYVWTNYGWFGVLFAGLGLTLAIVGMMVWWDRRR